MDKPILVSGVQPSGRLHIGNYLGMLKNAVELQNSGKYSCYYFIADLHSLTEEFEPKEKHRQIIELAADFLAAGLNPKKSVIFQQSQIPAHSELTWILNTITSLGELRRMTQFGDKMTQIALNKVYGKVFGGTLSLKEVEEREHDAKGQTMRLLKEEIEKYTNAGLFDYPVLMAADILLYDAKFVPVGEDQLQHLELTRTLARKFNKKFGKTFVEPQPILTKAPRVMNLGEPERKMSKSRTHPQNVIFIDDSREEITAKIKSAVTDSGSEVKYDLKKKPAISNLLTIYSAISDESIKNLEKKFFGKNYSEFKTALAKLMSNHFSDFRKKKKALLTKPSVLVNILEAGSEKAAKIANKKISEVKKKIGILG